MRIRIQIFPSPIADIATPGYRSFPFPESYGGVVATQIHRVALSRNLGLFSELSLKSDLDGVKCGHFFVTSAGIPIGQ